MIPFLVLVALGVAVQLLLLRVTKCRKDRQNPIGRLGGRFDFMLFRDVLSADSYTEEGQRWLPWLWTALVLLVGAVLVAAGALLSG